MQQELPTNEGGNGVAQKRCAACWAWKPREEFYVYSGSRDGLRGKCKECLREESRESRAAAVARRARGKSEQDKAVLREPPAHSAPGDSGASGESRTEADSCEELRRVADEGHDEDCGRGYGRSREREERLDLGLAIARATCEPGQCRTLEELAAYGGVSPQAIRRIEMAAMRKVRRRLAVLMREAEISAQEVGLL